MPADVGESGEAGNMNELMKLLDNGWDVEIHRQVDGKYCAAAKVRWKQSWKDVFAMLNELGQPADGEDILHGGCKYIHWRQIATGETPNEAARALVGQILGVTP